MSYALFYRQSAEAKVTADQTKTSGAAYALITGLSQAITTETGDILLIRVAITWSNSNVLGGQNFLRILVDGAIVANASRSSALPIQDTEDCVATQARVTGLAAGAHTIEVHWRTTASSARIRAGTLPDQEGGSLIVERVRV